MPIIIITVFLLYLNLKENPFFIQERPGYKEKTFYLIKLKTMKSINKSRRYLSDEERVTKFTKIIRKLRIDEFPQILNIIKGDMSFVGPRPLLLEYLDLYSEKERIRHSVLPGITGLAQINGSERLEFKKRLKLDVDYVRKLSFAKDLKIIFLTFIYVFKDFSNKVDHSKLPKF